MTSDHAPEDCAGPREAGRRLGVKHSYLIKLAGAKRLPRNEDGTFHIPTCRSILARITDPAQVRSGPPDKWSPSGHPTGHQPGKVVTGDHSSVTTDASTIPAPIGSLDDARAALNLVRAVLREEGVEGDGGPLTLGDVRTAEGILKVRERHIRITKAQGALIEAADAERTWAAMILRIRGRLLALPSQIGQALPHLPREDIAEIDRLLRFAMTEASGVHRSGDERLV